MTWISDPCPNCGHRLSFHEGPYIHRMANGIKARKYTLCHMDDCRCAGSIKTWPKLR